MAEESESGLAFGRTFSVSGELVVKQEPQEPVDEAGEDAAAGVDAEAELSFADLTFTEVSDVVLQRAVSPPSIDSSEEKIKDIISYLKEKHNIQESRVQLERCDKIWETLQLIKNAQDYACDVGPSSSVSSAQLNLPDSPSKRQPSKSSDRLSRQSSPVFVKKAVPNFRFSIKSKKKLYYCVTCGKEFVDSQHLKQHAENEHGIFDNPKRTGKPQADAQTTAAVACDEDGSELDSEEQESTNSSPESTNSLDSQQLESKQLLQQTECTDSEPINDIKSVNHSIKTCNVKEKVKCILCKRISADIVYHMKNYHKVGCINSIIAQCEIIPTEGSRRENLSQNDSSETLDVALRKRKRSSTCWTVKKKHQIIDKSTKSQTNGPFKCNVCLGLYKTPKSFSYHKTLHRIRGETPESFDPSKCRFLNSPLRNVVKTNNSFEETVSDTTSDQRDIVTTCSIKTNDSTTTQNELAKINHESIISEDSTTEQTICECGRSFRNYHTLYLHKVKCKEINDPKVNKSYLQSLGSDTDSGISINIKIKRNKNDCYEVVSRSNPSESIYKDSRSSKDSDASSSDSGMVSVDYNNHRPDVSELSSKYDKSHSILRIQVADDDEEVDIEDGEDINESDLNKSYASIKKLDNDQSHCVKESKTCPVEYSKGSGKLNFACSGNSNTAVYHKVPSLIKLCNQVLLEKKSTEEIPVCSNSLPDHASRRKINLKSKCPCGKKFKNFKYLNIHVRRYHPLLSKCNYCMTSFDRIEKYFEHECNVMEGKSFIEPIIQTQCTECKASVDLGEPFDRHMKTHNLDSATFQCFKCDLKFDNQHQRKSHFDIEHGYSLCRICKKLLHIDYVLKHEAYHDGSGYPCHICKKAFDQKTLLKKHIQNSHNPSVNEVVKCLVCLKKVELRHFKKHLSFHLHLEICKKCNMCPLNGDKTAFKNLNNRTALNSNSCDDSLSSVSMPSC